MKKNLIILIGLLFAGCGGGEGGSITEILPPLVTQVEVPVNATTLPLLVVQVEFNDQSFQSSALTWYHKIFGASNGQLNHYFREMSQDGFVFVQAHEDEYSINDGLIKVHLDINHPNTGVGDFSVIAIPALTAADEFIDFKAYDKNANGKIEIDELQIMFLVSGWEAASTPKTPSVWAHMYCIDGVSLDSVSVMQCDNGSYTAFGEKQFQGVDASIGVIAHELGHGAFYLPDLYDTDGTSEGIGAFGLMGGGSWGQTAGQNPGVTPVAMSAWSKIDVGFATATVISDPSNNFALEANELASYKPVRLSTANANEYFLLENRSSLGYDAGLYILDGTPFEGGLAIWHIDESQRAMDNSDNADDARRLVDFEEADAKVLDAKGNQGDQSNFFKNGNNVFTDTSTVSDSKLNGGASTNISVSNVSAPGSTMFIDVVPIP